jgi:hypothetical protein
MKGLQVVPAADLIEGLVGSHAPAVIGSDGNAEHGLCHHWGLLPLQL